METIAFRMVLNPGMREEYERRHSQIWPELVDALHNAGVRDYRTFFDPESNHLFAMLTRTSSHTMDALPQLDVMRVEHGPGRKGRTRLVGRHGKRATWRAAPAQRSVIHTNPL